ncbi:MAG: hypothetical protein WA908_07030 [Pontixanthobacter sp.]
MHKISRIHPTRKMAELPWRNRAHQFVLTAPESGTETTTEDYAEAVAMVRAGHSIRMSDGRHTATFVTPASLTFTEALGVPVDRLWFYTMPRPRFSREALKEDIRDALAGLALETFWLAGQKAADAFLGTAFDKNDVDGLKASVDLDRYDFAHIVLTAYDSAFRTGRDRSLDIDERERLASNIAATFSGAKRRVVNPVDLPSSAIRQTMLCAHWRPLIFEGKLFDDDLVAYSPVTRLAILTSTTEASVRNALSKRQVKLPVRSQDYESTIDWLQGAHGFAPLRQDERHISG